MLIMEESRRMILIPLEKYNSLVNNKDYTKPDYTNPKSIEPVSEVYDDDDISDSDLSSVDVQPLPKTYKHRDTALVTFLQQCRCVTWDECGVISTEKFGRIHVSHISDLIRDCIKSYIHFSPDGQEDFYTALAESNVPLGLISNSHGREWIQRYRRRKQKGRIKK